MVGGGGGEGGGGGGGGGNFKHSYTHPSHTSQPPNPGQIPG